MIESDIQYIAMEIAIAFHEEKKFPLYARAVKKMGPQKTWEIFSEAKQESRTPHRFFIRKCLSKKAKIFPQAS